MLPAWLALREQVPTVFNVTVLPDTVQTEVEPEENVTVRPALVLAVSGTEGESRPPLAGPAKVMIWAPRATANVRVTPVAAAYAPLPLWVAVIEQVPAPTIVAVEPDTVHTGDVVEAKLTESPEVAEPVRDTGATPKVTSPGWVKLTVWAV